MRRMARLRRQRGFIMAEVVIAIMIIGIALIAIAGMFIQSTNATSGAAEYTAATNLAQKQLELLKLQPYTYWKNIAVTTTIAWQGTVGETDPYSVATTASVSAENSNLVEVVVVVSWTQQGQSRQVQLTAFYSKVQ